MAMTEKRRVCLIDDDIFTRDALSLGLGEAGYQVFVAPGAAAGLDLVAREGIDVIVTDLSMPGISGAQLISEVRERWPDLPIIAITGVDVSPDCNPADLARQVGADASLIKPFRAQQLVRLLETVIATRRGST